MYLQNPDKYYTAHEIAKKMPSISCDRRMHSKSRLYDKDVYTFGIGSVAEQKTEKDISANETKGKSHASS